MVVFADRSFQPVVSLPLNSSTQPLLSSEYRLPAVTSTSSDPSQPAYTRMVAPWKHDPPCPSGGNADRVRRGRGEDNDIPPVNLPDAPFRTFGTFALAGDGCCRHRLDRRGAAAR